MKYRQENNVKLCHQEKVYLGETMALNDRVESMRRKISDLEKKLKEAEGDLYGERLRIQDLELQKKNMRSGGYLPINCKQKNVPYSYLGVSVVSW